MVLCKKLLLKGLFLQRFILLLSLASLFSGCEHVRKREPINHSQDTAAPTITLNGKKSITLPLHQSFIDPGAKANDDFDGDLSDKIETSGSVNVDKIGTYTLTYSIKDSAGNSATIKREIHVTTYANARLGRLANASVTLYKFNNDGTKSVVWQKESLSSSDFSKIGAFDTDAWQLNSQDLYLIEIKGGKDYDSNNDANKDTTPQTNSGTLRAVVTLDDISSLAQNLNITALSELTYEELLPLLKHNYSKSEVLAKQESLAKELIDDINQDGVVDYKDILSFDPTSDQSHLKGALYNNYNSLANTIKEGKIALLNLSQKLATIKTNGFVRDITFNQDRSKLYVANGDGGITIINSATNRVTKTIKTNDFARHVVLNSDESIAYVADSKAGLSVIDLDSNKIIANTPTYEGNTTKDRDARYIQLDSDASKLYLAASTSGVLVFDTTNPKEPKKVATFATSHLVHNIKLNSDKSLLYAADEDGLSIYNTQNGKLLGHFKTYGTANSVTLNKDETKAYIADGYKGVVIVDISDPTSINYLKHIKTSDFASAVTLNSDETKIFISGRKSNIQIANLTKEYPKVEQTIQTPYRTYAIKLASNESYLYAATGTNGVEIVATKALKNPFILTSIPNNYKAYKGIKKDNFLYIPSGKAGLQIVDTSNDNSPETVTTFDTDGFTLDVAIDGATAYLADGYKGIKVLNISDKSNPTVVNSLDTDGFTSSLQLIPNKNLLIVSDGSKGIKLFDAQNLTLLDSYQPQSKPLDITLSSDKKSLFVALGKAGILELTISNDKLTKAQTITTQTYVKHITIDGNLAYISGDSAKLLIMDLATKKITHTIAIGDFAYSSSADANYIYIANSKDGVTIINKDNYKNIGSIKCQGDIRDVLVDTNVAYAASSEGGVCVIDTSLLK